MPLRAEWYVRIQAARGYNDQGSVVLKRWQGRTAYRAEASHVACFGQAIDGHLRLSRKPA